MDTVTEADRTELDEIVVRTMREEDLDAVVTIDAAAAGRRRPSYFARMLQRALTHADLQISLVAERDDRLVGFVVATLFYGEFGVAEPAATIDAIAVEPGQRGKQVGRALVRQLRLNLGALRITTLRTEVSWDDFDLLAFFRSQGFAPARRLCLESIVDPTAPAD